MKSISIVRDRGQLTIPDSIRRVVTWIAPMSAVTISVIKPDVIIIEPHQRQVDWDQVWKNIRKSRTISGKGKTSAAQFLEHDRSSH